jgi:hypothetical protein
MQDGEGKISVKFKGILNFSDGGKYEGGWKEGKMHGAGVYTYPNGDVFEGVWEHGKKTGKGYF